MGKLSPTFFRKLIDKTYLQQLEEVERKLFYYQQILDTTGTFVYQDKTSLHHSILT